MKTFVNCSNHPSGGWTQMQKEDAEAYGEIVDVPFPFVSCELSAEQLECLADQTFHKIMEHYPSAVMCMGEFVVCFRIVQKLKAEGIKVVASCSERRSTEHIEEDGSVRKEAQFVFKGLREY